MGKLCTFGAEGGVEEKVASCRQIVSEWLQLIDGINNGNSGYGRKIT